MLHSVIRDLRAIGEASDKSLDCFKRLVTLTLDTWTERMEASWYRAKIFIQS